jgi:D-tyrosyl-tRNA(Tyr) deacylase
MRCVVQRVAEASVTVDQRAVASIGPGMLVLAAFLPEDDSASLRWAARKLAALRIFDDSDGVMNLSVGEVDGDILAVSQFTLYGDLRKGNRPSYHRAAPGEVAQQMYEEFVTILTEEAGRPVEQGVFGAEMQVSLINDGPVTLILDYEERRRDR